jgi:hypothetical protein
MKTDPTKMDKYYIECECGTDEHLLVFHYDEEYNEIYTSVQMSPFFGVFKRIWKAIKYVFGYKCKYGHWDCTMLKSEDYSKLRDLFHKAAMQATYDRLKREQEKKLNDEV